MGDRLKPCPFCGGSQILALEGSTFRWVVAECAGCGARCGEVRADRDYSMNNEGLVKKWNTRADLVLSLSPTEDRLRAGLQRAAELARHEFKRSSQLAEAGQHDCVWMGGYEDACDHLSGVFDRAAAIDSVPVSPTPQPDSTEMAERCPVIECQHSAHVGQCQVGFGSHYCPCKGANNEKQT